MSDLFDSAASREARDIALHQVASHSGDFMEQGLEAIRSLPPLEFTGEAIRRQLTAMGITPHHFNAWGALVRSAIKRGMLIDTGRTAPMTAIGSHARKTTVYSKVSA